MTQQEEIEDLVKRLEQQGADAFHKHYSLGMWKLCGEAASALRHQRQIIADLAVEADRHVEEITQLRNELDATQAWPCDGEGDERGNFVCKKDAKIAELERQITLHLEIADAREFDWRQAKRSVREAIAEWETIKQQTICQCNGQGFDGKTCLRCRADTVFKRIALEAE